MSVGVSCMGSLVIWLWGWNRCRGDECWCELYGFLGYLVVGMEQM